MDWPAPLDQVTVRTVAFGLGCLGAVAGVLGTFAVVRRQSLQGDAISHAALPGIALCVLVGLRQPLLLILGAAVAGWLAMTLVAAIVRNSRVPFDSALAGALAVFFGFGLVLVTYLQRLAPRVPENALERWIVATPLTAEDLAMDKFLFGEAAFLRAEQGWQIALLGGIAVLVAVLCWKEFQIVSFDREFAASLGYSPRWIDALLTTLIVVAVVIGLTAVGVVLMSALLVAPATAARQWTHRLGRMATVAAGFGFLAGFVGAIAGDQLSKACKAAVPTGPTVVLTATAIVLLSMLQSGLRRADRSRRKTAISV